MVNILLTAALVAFVTVGGMDYLKSLFLNNASSLVKKIVSIVFTIVVGILASLLSGCTVIQTIAVIVFALVIVKLGYDYIFKLFNALTEYFKNKIKMNS